MSYFKKIKMKENRARFHYLINMDESEFKKVDPVIYRHKMTDKEITEKIEPVKSKKEQNRPKRQYFKKVRELTKTIDKTKIPGYVKELVYNHRRDGVMVTAYNKLVIDHKIPLIYGYKNGIPPEHIADISNLQYLTVRDNMIKGTKPLVDDQNEWILHR